MSVFSDNGCRDPLLDGGAPGAECVRPEDCAEVCCNCDNPNDIFLEFGAQVCSEGVCPASEEVCEIAKDVATMCEL